MTTAEAMALAVLKGDMVAARQLADYLLEREAEGIKLQPVQIVNARTKAAVFFREGATSEQIDSDGRTISAWLAASTGRVISLPPHVDRIELYEMKDAVR